MSWENGEKVCFQYICPKYPKCARARGKGCCIEEPEDKELLVCEGECGAETGFPLFIKEVSG